jgi:hypothetical protein
MKSDLRNVLITLFVPPILLILTAAYNCNSSTDAGWRNATTELVKEHNRTHVLHKVELKDMNPGLLREITDRCTVWDWRERDKCFNMTKWVTFARVYSFRSAQILEEWKREHPQEEVH